MQSSKDKSSVFLNSFSKNSPSNYPPNSGRRLGFIRTEIVRIREALGKNEISQEEADKLLRNLHRHSLRGMKSYL
jgi:hypothetical protein